MLNGFVVGFLFVGCFVGRVDGGGGGLVDEDPAGCFAEGGTLRPG